METLEDFCTILMGKKIMVCTDQKNLTKNYMQHDWDHILFQRQIIEEYRLGLKYIKVINNEGYEEL